MVMKLNQITINNDALIMFYDKMRSRIVPFILPTYRFQNTLYYFDSKCHRNKNANTYLPTYYKNTAYGPKGVVEQNYAKTYQTYVYYVDLIIITLKKILNRQNDIKLIVFGLVPCRYHNNLKNLSN